MEQPKTLSISWKLLFPLLLKDLVALDQLSALLIQFWFRKQFQQILYFHIKTKGRIKIQQQNQ